MNNTMLSFHSPRWAELEHAYGSAVDIPILLGQLPNLPAAQGKAEPWFSLWSALAHQGDVYSASFAAVPHVVAALASSPLKADSAYFQFPAWVEICRIKTEVSIPEDLKAAYFEAIHQLPSLVAAAAERLSESGFLACSLSAIAASGGHAAIAEAILEISSSAEAEEFLEWKYNR